MKVYYVDDRKTFQAHFLKVANAFNALDEIKSFSCAEDALAESNTSKPDIIFIDIDMPGKDGLWLASRLNVLQIPFVFLTSYNNYASQAFGVNALHYVEKPITAAKYTEALKRLNLKKNSVPQQAESKSAAVISDSVKSVIPQRIFINNIQKTSVIDVDRVSYFIAASSYTKVTMNDATQYVSSKTLSTYHDLLISHPDFVRIHRGSLINKKFVEAILKEKHKIYALMRDNTKLEVSPAYRETIYEMLS